MRNLTKQKTVSSCRTLVAIKPDMTKILKAIIWTSYFLTICSCDPKTYGSVIIDNSSTEKMRIVFTSNTPFIDSTIIINPNESRTLFEFDHWGHPKKYNCCPCEFKSITISPVDTNKRITKDIKEKSNWTIDKSHVKMWKYHHVDCHFELKQSDIN